MSHVWLESEGDHWYERNKCKLGKAIDVPLLAMDLYGLKPKKVLEVGASNGYRLQAMYKKYGSNATAIEPSQKAVEDGRTLYPSVKFIHSTCEDCSLAEIFDLVIVNFVLHWVDRDALYRCITKIDQWVSNQGHLIIGDFGPDHFLKRKFHHLKDENIYTWKMPYQQLFLQSGAYMELAKLRFNCDTLTMESNINEDSMGTVVLLKKQQMYREY